MANMVDYLSDQYRFFIITRNTDYTETTPYTSIRSNCWEEYSENVKVFYADEVHQNQSTFKNLIKEVNPDILYINGVYSWKFSILPLIIRKSLKLNKVIVASRGMLAQSAIDVKGGKKRLFLKLARLAGLYRNVVFHATNQKEEQDIKGVLGKRLKVIVADNLPKKNLPELKLIEKKVGKLKLVSLARIAPEKNTLFALERLLEITSFNGTIDFDLYGQIYNQEYWRECMEVIEQLPDNITVNYKGTVDAELVGTTIQNYHALFMPTRGENFGHVILESLSTGRPVLISDQTPWRGLEKDRCGWDLELEVKGLKVKGERLKEKGEGFKVKGEGLEVKGGVWCAVLGSLVEMEQEEFNVWCRGARKRAEAFVNNDSLGEQYSILFR